MDMHIEDIRRDYKVGSLSRKDMPANPIQKMEEWLQEAIDHKVIEPTAIVVTTSTPDGHPSSRTVLIKEINEGKIIFYSNYDSRKGRQIKANPHVSVTFLWHQLERQIHVEGICKHVAPEVSDAYFDKRPYKSRVGARISPQSQPIPSRAFIVTEFAKESLKYTGTFRKVPRPDNWGGFEVTPSRIEFWQGRESRLHDRFLYEIQEDGSWSLDRLAP
ncbi:pyridoxamine 5'-phosphate oxidase [Porphyromonas levii]|uniref:Pyridoxine/pyridoxamine 5'-phosphate oxidase n=1 Tax=Porphyromonas levii TaxID=28114 RepID=A0A4Y8WRZ1_9PORP|nr:pyridoxamine 5'-phosphate oxidase [Porphyromonas levii]MBR8713278.1 Pyridoxine/pyridoxamine 5'-phosphate oxidase [Porphyromonas levii]MBR8715312.1 Pyridoxine/pyridoxamine 5'-phosphate oxidase [Porphyromonas levii]MBR8727838.1 Pyridoxine/pyridoxamine 5'-phosphate oxidase [Porphyromonas levii]MBR8731068.1 Pyridoxine/pyridoxamine 5'-phosphate oxidase [Porphyromonas levii]MBR8736182.1 Pyridoxine/pyridoxamine 5'-phosphate oxidase [Porphyromonas levii]